MMTRMFVVSLKHYQTLSGKNNGFLSNVLFDPAMILEMNESNGFGVKILTL